MDQFVRYIHSPEFSLFLEQTAVPFILAALVLSLIALLLEVRLPIRYYWNLPWHSVRALLQGFHLVKPHPVWGKSYLQVNNRPMSLVAVELIDPVTNAVLSQTYTNRHGEYGFALTPGKYLLRAIKTRYRLPSMLDPENVQVVGIDESFAVPVIVVNKEVAPIVDLPLVPVKEMSELTPWQNTTHYLRMFLFQFANAMLGLLIIISLFGLWAEREPFYGVVLAISLVLLFIKLYILETISALTRSSNA